MAFLRILGGVEIRTAFAVVVVSLIGGMYSFVDTAFAQDSLLSPLASLKLVFLYAVTLGLPVALVIGAPIYALLSYKNVAWWPTVLLVGALPGFVVLYTTKDSGLGAWYVVCGIAVAFLTHLMWHRSFPRFWRARVQGNAL